MRGFHALALSPERARTAPSALSRRTRRTPRVIRFYYHPTPNPQKSRSFWKNPASSTRLSRSILERANSMRPLSAPSIRTARSRPSSTPTASAEGRRGCSIRRLSSSTSQRKQASFWARRPTGRNSCHGFCSLLPASARSRARPCISNRRRLRAWPMRSIDTVGRPSVTISPRRSSCRTRLISLATAIRSPTCRPGVGSIGRRGSVPESRDPLGDFPNLKRLYESGRTPPGRSPRSRGRQGPPFKTAIDEEARRALYPSNYPGTA